MRMPATRKQDLSDTLFGKTVADPFRWLEDEAAPEVQQWMTEQDDYARAELPALPNRDLVEARIKELFYYDSIGAPTHRNGRYFYSRKHADKEKTIVYWKQGEDGEETVLFDPNGWSADGSTGLHGYWPSHDGKHVAFQISEHNSDETVMHVLEVATGKETGVIIEGTKYAAASWTPDGMAFYYTWVPPIGGEVSIADRPGFAELRSHVIGTDPENDAIVHPATRSAETFLGGGISRDGHWLLAQIQHGWNSSDVFFKDARVPDATWQPLVVGVDANFSVEIWEDVFYIHTNDGAPRYKLIRATPTMPERAQWTVLVAETDATLEHASVVGGHLVLGYLQHACSRLAIHTLRGKHVRDVALPGIGTSSGISGEPDEDLGYFAFTSFTEPQQIFRTSIASGTTTEWARISLPIETSRITTDQVWFPSKDGTKISMFIIHNKEVKRDGSNPTILYGYGGFSVSMTPGFAGSRIVWLEQGGVYAIPNLRGGGEYGEDWHKAGMLLEKQNVFDDFIAAAEYLQREGWTSPAHLAVSGGSNGGLLTGAMVTQRPELFGAVVCAVPLLDMLRYQLFGSGKTWVPEYGSPDDAEQFAVLWAYSPYRVAVDGGQREYPATLFESADHDDRVDPMHARKLAAALQASQNGAAPIYLRIERNAGHGGSDMVKSAVGRVVDQFAFLLHALK
ncbi:prolyl oligopeptidase family serine peptidase [soil metagenome]